jgi:ABC-type polysaccharide/polyol phosphate export permease
MVAGVGEFRSALVGHGGLPPGIAVVSFASGLILAALGFLYFGRVERRFADVI